MKHFIVFLSVVSIICSEPMKVWGMDPQSLESGSPNVSVSRAWAETPDPLSPSGTASLGSAFQNTPEVPARRKQLHECWMVPGSVIKFANLVFIGRYLLTSAENPASYVGVSDALYLSANTMDWVFGFIHGRLIDQETVKSTKCFSCRPEKFWMVPSAVLRITGNLLSITGGLTPDMSESERYGRITARFGCAFTADLFNVGLGLLRWKKLSQERQSRVAPHDGDISDEYNKKVRPIKMFLSSRIFSVPANMIGMLVFRQVLDPTIVPVAYGLFCLRDVLTAASGFKIFKLKEKLSTFIEWAKRKG